MAAAITAGLGVGVTYEVMASRADKGTATARALQAQASTIENDEKVIEIMRNLQKRQEANEEAARKAAYAARDALVKAYQAGQPTDALRLNYAEAAYADGWSTGGATYATVPAPLLGDVYAPNGSGGRYLAWRLVASIADGLPAVTVVRIA
ncbi:MAG TPA: hypothetical protein VI322_05065 [Candidatus Saccharimonadia bacterium]